MLLLNSCVPVITWLCSRAMRFHSRPTNWPLLTIESPVAQWLEHPTRSWSNGRFEFEIMQLILPIYWKKISHFADVFDARKAVHCFVCKRLYDRHEAKELDSKTLPYGRWPRYYTGHFFVPAKHSYIAYNWENPVNTPNGHFKIPACIILSNQAVSSCKDHCDKIEVPNPL